MVACDGHAGQSSLDITSVSSTGGAQGGSGVEDVPMGSVSAEEE